MLGTSVSFKIISFLFENTYNNLVIKCPKLLIFISRITFDFKKINTLRASWFVPILNVVWFPFYASHIFHINS